MRGLKGVGTSSNGERAVSEPASRPAIFEILGEQLCSAHAFCPHEYPGFVEKIILTTDTHHLRLSIDVEFDVVNCGYIPLEGLEEDMEQT